MVDESRYPQFGAEGLRDVKGVVVHNTNNYDMSARQLHDWMNTECRTSQGTHFIVDHEGAVQAMPCDWRVWSTGMGNDYAFEHLISIEICSNLNDALYLEGQRNAVELIKSLMETYGFTKKGIRFHRDYCPSAYCPATILDMYGTRKRFIEENFKEE